MLCHLRPAWNPNWKKPLLIAGLLTGFYVIGGFLLAPTLVKWAAERYVAQTLHHQLSMDKPEINPLTLSVRITNLRLAEPNGAPLVAFKELFADFAASSLLRWAYTFDALRLNGLQADLELRADGSLNFSKLIEALNKDKKEDTGLPRFLIQQFALEKGRFNFTDRRVSPVYTNSLDPLDLNLTELSTLPDDQGAYQLTARNLFGAEMSWRGVVELKPVVMSGSFNLQGLNLSRLSPYLKARLTMAPPEGVFSFSTTYQLGYDKRQLALSLDNLNIKLAALQLKGMTDKEPTIALQNIELKGGRINLQNQNIEVDELLLQGGQFNLLRRVDGRLALQDWLKTIDIPAAAADKPSVPNKPWHIQLKRFALDGVRWRVLDQGFITPLTAQADNLKVDFNAEMTVGGAEPKLIVNNFDAHLAGWRVQSGASPVPLLALSEIALENGQLDLAAQKLTIGSIALRNGKLEAVRDAQGHIAQIDALRMHPPLSKPTPRTAVNGKPNWQYAVEKIELADFQVLAKDMSTRPAAEITLEAMHGSIAGFNQNRKAPLQVQLAFHVKQGGSFNAQGTLVAAAPSVDLKLKLADVAVAPAQPYLASVANLQFASGAFSTEGRLRYRNEAFTYDGGMSVRDMLLNEAGTKNRFLAWKTLATNNLSVTQKGLDIGELKLDGLGAKLIIHEDKTTNVQHVFVSSKPSPAAKPAVAAPSDSANKAAPFNVNIERVRVQNGEVDFADLSLTLPFGTRIHKVRGGLNSISSRPGAPTQLELDGTVDDYGLARAVGQIDLFHPTDLTDIKLVFRNVEMTHLTPYSSTFAGYKIASGKLSLDLEYKIKARQMLGENKIIMDQLTLGERVEEPNIKHLPLGLAIALLKDSDGKIDLGLPVSGSLDDPQFSYGQIISKAITNIIVKIVTSPFRALSALIGVGGDKLEKVSFDAGVAKLTPPEREKIKLIAQAMNKRPGLALTVHGTYAPQADRAALKERQLRYEVAAQMDIKLEPDEDPGPITTANPKVRDALESVYKTRLGSDALRQFKAKYRQVNPDKEIDSGVGKVMSRLTELIGPKPQLSEQESAQLKGADFFELLYRRLLETVAVPDAALQTLAQARGEGAFQELIAADAPKERTALGAPTKIDDESREVALKLELGVAPKPAASTPAQ